MIFSNKIVTLSVKNFDKQIHVRCSATVETFPWACHGKVVVRHPTACRWCAEDTGHGVHACGPQARIACPGKAADPGRRLLSQCQGVVTQTFAKRSSASFKVSSCFAKQNRTIPDSFGVL